MKAVNTQFRNSDDLSIKLAAPKVASIHNQTVESNLKTKLNDLAELSLGDMKRAVEELNTTTKVKLLQQINLDPTGVNASKLRMIKKILDFDLRKVFDIAKPPKPNKEELFVYLDSIFRGNHVRDVLRRNPNFITAPIPLTENIAKKFNELKEAFLNSADISFVLFDNNSLIKSSKWSEILGTNLNGSFPKAKKGNIVKARLVNIPNKIHFQSTKIGESPCPFLNIEEVIRTDNEAVTFSEPNSNIDSSVFKAAFQDNPKHTDFRKLIAQQWITLLALDHLHKNNKAHCDYHNHNNLLAGNKPLLSDFEFAQENGSQSMFDIYGKKLLGTPEYHYYSYHAIKPDFFDQIAAEDINLFQGDIFAASMAIIELLIQKQIPKINIQNGECGDIESIHRSLDQTSDRTSSELRCTLKNTTSEEPKGNLIELIKVLAQDYKAEIESLLKNKCFNSEDKAFVLNYNDELGLGLSIS